MIGEDRCRKYLQQALDLSGVDEVEAYLSGQDLALTRFANNAIHQNVVHGDAQLNIRAVIAHQQGRATTNDLSDSGIARAREEARSNALLMPEDPDFQGLPQSQDPCDDRCLRRSHRRFQSRGPGGSGRPGLPSGGEPWLERGGLLPDRRQRKGRDEYSGHLGLPPGHLRWAADRRQERILGRMGQG